MSVNSNNNSITSDLAPSDMANLPTPPPRRYSGVNPNSNPSNPFSAFYSHPHTRLSLQQARIEKSARSPYIQERDLEAGLDVTTFSEQKALPVIVEFGTQPDTKGFSLAGESVTELKDDDSSEAPDEKEIDQDASRSKKHRRCGCLEALNIKHKVAVGMLTAMVLISLAIALGYSISRNNGDGDGHQTTSRSGGQ